MEEELGQTRSLLKESSRQAEGRQSDLNDAERKLMEAERKVTELEELRQALQAHVSELTHEVESRAEHMQML